MGVENTMALEKEGVFAKVSSPLKQNPTVFLNSQSSHVQTWYGLNLIQ